MRIEVGVDVGGTFTDAVVAADGELIRAKAYSTRDVTGGILDVLSRARQQLELDEPTFFGAIDKFVLGNTIVTNVIDELRFPRVGLLTTAGFKDTLRIARSARGPSRDAHANVPPPQIVERERIVEIGERVDVERQRARRGRPRRRARRDPGAARPGRRRDRRLLPVVVQERRQRAGGRRAGARARAGAAADAVERAGAGLPRVRADGDDGARRRLQAARREPLRGARRGPARARARQRPEADAGRRRLPVGRRGRQDADQDVQLGAGRRRRGRPPARRGAETRPHRHRRHGRHQLRRGDHRRRRLPRPAARRDGPVPDRADGRRHQLDRRRRRLDRLDRRARPAARRPEERPARSPARPVTAAAARSRR